MAIVFVDTETTGLVKPAGTDLGLQPYIVELCIIRTDDDLNVNCVYDELIKPPVPLPDNITKITGIKPEELADKKTFDSHYRAMCSAFLGCHTFVAHNAPFDSALIDFELQRIGKRLQFPWPPIHYCTVEQSMWVKGHRLKLAELYYAATGIESIKGAHRAVNDVRAMIESYKWLKLKESQNVA